MDVRSLPQVIQDVVQCAIRVGNGAMLGSPEDEAINELAHSFPQHLSLFELMTGVYNEQKDWEELFVFKVLCLAIPRSTVFSIDFKFVTFIPGMEQLLGDVMLCSTSLTDFSLVLCRDLKEESVAYIADVGVDGNIFLASILPLVAIKTNVV